MIYAKKMQWTALVEFDKMPAGKALEQKNSTFVIVILRQIVAKKKSYAFFRQQCKCPGLASLWLWFLKKKSWLSVALMCDTHHSKIHINIRGKYISHLGGSVCHNCLDIRLGNVKIFWPCTPLALISEEKDGCLQYSCVVLHTFQNSKNMVGQNTLPNQIDHHCATVRTFDSEMNISVNNAQCKCRACVRNLDLREQSVL